ncbi:YueI family protein [Fructilactobacillus carniphilus]|uniref:YueI family protein n=1 Tax=Fructilactobacillus carniphilus TaxID=2940297 RepID=A0ABY5BZ96_9LACO|nr:YueI family protein [Fructilactobacillus carniphilus]USS91268.1 YueI family protein [Fructilactobacillus carniphilus]
MPNENNVQDRLDQAMNGGTPQINPDEQRQYLGTFRERVALVVSVREVGNDAAIKQVRQLLEQHSNYSVLINGNLDSALQSPYLKLAGELHAKFTLKNNADYGTAADQAAVVIAAPNAINVESIAFHAPAPQPEEPQKSGHQSFWQRLFHH